MAITIPWFGPPGGPQDAAGVVRQLGIPAHADWAMISSIKPIRLDGQNVELLAQTPREVYSLPFAPEVLRGWEGYHLSVIGVLLSASPEVPAWPRWKIQTAVGFIDLQIWRLQAHLPDTLALAEVLWQPGPIGIQKSIRLLGGWESLAPAKQDRAILSAAGGMRAIEGILKRRGGRPADWPDEATFRAKVEPVVRSLRTRRGKAIRDQAAEELHISSDYLKDLTHDLTGLSWPDFVKTVPDKKM